MFSVNTSIQGEPHIDQIGLRLTHSIKQTGLLGVMQDRAYVSAYRARAIKLDQERSRARSYVSSSRAHKSDVDSKKTSIKHLRRSQSSCFLRRALIALGEMIKPVTDQSARKQDLYATPASL